MGVYIKGIEMPKEDEEIIIRIDSSGTVMTEYALPISWAKAVPVPPHGRLGDLDELAKQVEHGRYHHTHTDGLAARHHIAEYGHFLNAIADFPTIIEAEEQSGNSGELEE